MSLPESGHRMSLKRVGAAGICADIVKAAFAAEVIKAEFRFYPWKRALRSLKQAGWMDLFHGLNVMKEKKYFYTPILFTK